MAGPEMEPLEQSRFGVWLDNVMRKRRLSQSELARRVGVSQPAISRWLKGEAIPTLDNAERLSDVLDVPMNEILVLVGIIPRDVRLGPSARHTHLHDLIDDLPDGLVDPMIVMVEAIIRESR